MIGRHYEHSLLVRSTAQGPPCPPLSPIRLDDDVRATLEAEARSRGVGLATLLRQIAAEAARNVRRARIRAQSAAVGRIAAEGPARQFYRDWGTPTTDAE